jgi:hypothetical protein
MKKSSLTAIVLAFIAANVVQATPLEEKLDHWKQRLSTELPVGSPKDAILAWASKNRVKATERLGTSQLTLRLESVSFVPPEKDMSASASGVTCGTYRISATLELDAKNQLKSVLVACNS